MKINQIIKTRLRLLEHSKKDFKTIFEIIHHNKEFVFCEKTDGFRIKQTTYGECYNYSYKMGKFLSEKLDYSSEYVGLMMDNSLEFITTFYGILMNNKKPVLINIRLGNTLNNQIIERLNIKDVVCDNDYEINANKIFVIWQIFFTGSRRNPQSLPRNFQIPEKTGRRGILTVPSQVMQPATMAAKAESRRSP